MEIEKAYAAVIPLAGAGRRMGAKARKQYMMLGNKSIAERTVERFLKSGFFHVVVLVVPVGECLEVEQAMTALAEDVGFTGRLCVVEGGETRQASVRLGLKVIKSCETVFVHDGVRPFVNLAHTVKGLELMATYDGFVEAVPAIDTLKVVENGQVVETLDRSKLWCVQTPQVFKYELLCAVHEKAHAEGFVGTDDASLVEHYGYTVGVHEGLRHNIKITTPYDLAIGRAIIAEEALR